MYYLMEFCRICIKTDAQLLDIDTVDFDSVRLSEKLEFCMKMVITRESLSTQICLQCIKKLRVSYEFANMCRQSSKILQGYLTELISTSAKVTPESFINSELRVTLTPLSKHSYKRKRITKEQRCSLLKKLLTSKKKEPKKEKAKGGLRDILNFTRDYDFGYKLDRNHNNYETSPLGRLVNFTNSFFIDNFADFRNTILYIIENKDHLFESDEDDDEADLFESDEEGEIEEEELIVEPDIKIKTEFDYEDCDLYSACNYYVETSYSDSECKRENIETDEVGQVSIKQEQFEDYEEPPKNSMQMLDKLVEDWGQKQTFSRLSLRCRTRGNPYINPQLKQQFEMRSFQCTKCRRYFKSPGYLKAHVSKLHH